MTEENKLDRARHLISEWSDDALRRAVGRAIDWAVWRLSRTGDSHGPIVGFDDLAAAVVSLQLPRAADVDVPETRARILSMSSEDRRTVLREALEWAQRWSRGEGPRADWVTWLAASLILLDDGRRYAVETMRLAADRIRDWGPGPSVAAFSDVVRRLEYGAGRLGDEIDRRIEPELFGGEHRATLAQRALDHAESVLAAVPGSIDDDPAPLTDEQALASSFVTTVERLLSLGSRPRRTRCSWCVRALGQVAAASLDERDMVAHALSCEHSPGAVAVRALRLAHQARASVSAQRAHVASGVAEIDRLLGGVGPYAVAPALPDPHVVDVEVCARCGDSHSRLEFHALERPMAPAETTVMWTHWAPCPTNGQPIMRGPT